MCFQDAEKSALQTTVTNLLLRGTNHCLVFWTIHCTCPYEGGVDVAKNIREKNIYICIYACVT